MKAAILAASLLLSFAGAAHAAPAPQVSASFEDPNNVYSAAGSTYQAAKKKLGACGAVAQGDAPDARFIHASATTTPIENAFTRAARTNSVY